MAASEVKFEALGQSWRFKFGFGALCALEEEFDLPFARIIQRVMPELSIADFADPGKIEQAVFEVRLTDIRSILSAGIAGDLTREQVEDIVDDIGVPAAVDIVKRAMIQDLSGGKADATENPRKPRRRK